MKNGESFLSGSFDLENFCFCLGLAFLTYGASFISRPAALFTAGGSLIVIAILLAVRDRG